MAIKTRTRKEISEEAILKIPLSALRCLLRYPKEKKIICEIDLGGLKRPGRGKTLDEIINEARLDYALGDYSTHRSAKSLIAELRS